MDLSEKFGGASARALALMQMYPLGKITLAALKDSPVAQYATEKNLPVIIVGRRKYGISILFSLVHAIRSFGFEIVDAQNIQSKFWASLSTSLTRTALVSTLNSWYANEHGTASIKGKVYSAIELLTNWSSPHYIVVSKAIYNSLLKAGINSNRITLIHNAVDADLKKMIEKKIGIRSELKIPLNSILCVALGRLVWAKGYEILVQALTMVNKKNNRIYCLIMGDGELYSSLSKKITQSGLENHIFLYGHCAHSDALSILRACDIFVMPSRAEGTPVALLEAAALEIPILATKVGGIPELVTDEDALLVPANDPVSLANGLLKLTKDGSLSQSLSKKARSRVEKFFTLDIQLEATIATYNKVLLS